MSESPTTPADQPQRIRIYLSAPAADMQAEREVLTRYVLPELNDRCSEMNVQLELVDVRRDPAQATASPAQMVAVALAGIDECRPWFIGLLGDKCEAAVDVSPELAEEHPWLNDRGGASLVELELAYGALHGEGPHTRLVYVRDDRFLRDMSAEEKAEFSSEDIADVERLESLKAELREADVKLVDGYPCRWDAEGQCITDLEEFGKQLVDDLYDAVLQQFDPAMMVSVFEEETTAGAAAAMIGSGGGQSNPPPPSDEGDDEEDIDFGTEEVHDVAGGGDDSSSSASAIEGVEMLDFLDDELDEVDDPPTPAAAAEPTLDLSAAPDEPEQLDLEESDVTELEDAAGDDEWDFDEVSPIEDEEADEPSDVGPSEPTVSRTEKTTTIPPAADDAVDDDAAAEADEFTLEPPAAEPATAAPAVQPASLAAKPKKKKSSLPMILIALAALLLVGAGVGGLYFAGLLPGTGGDAGPTAATGGSGTGGNNNANAGNQADAARASRIAEHTAALSALVQAAQPNGEAVDEDKLNEAQTYLQNIADNEADLLQEQSIADLQSQLAMLESEFEQQTEAARVKEFRTALDSARALQDAGLLEEAQRLAQNDDERNLVAALATEIEDHQREQAAGADAETKKADALTAIVNSVGDAEMFRQALDAYATAYPEDPRSADFQNVAQAEATKMNVATEWNDLLNSWANEDMSNLSPQAAAEKAATTEARLKLAKKLPGAAQVQTRLAALQAIAARESGEASLVDELAKTFDNPAVKTSLVFATTDGKRYYLADKPTKNGNNYTAKYFADFEGAIKEAAIAPGDIDRDQTGRVELAAMAQSVTDEIAKIDELGWETAFLQAMRAAQSPIRTDESTKPLDEVIQTQWLLALMDIASRGSRLLASAIADEQKKLVATGVTPNFNWADPAAAAEKRGQCADAIIELRSLSGLIPYVEGIKKSLQSLPVQGRIKPVGVLLRDSGPDGKWRIELADDAPESAQLFEPRLFLLGSWDADPPLEYSMVGWFRDGKASVDPPLDDVKYEQGQVFYAVVRASGNADGIEPAASENDVPKLEFNP